MLKCVNAVTSFGRYVRIIFNSLIIFNTEISPMQEFIVRKKVNIHAEPSEVWDALTNPEKTKKYFFNCGIFSEWKEGSPITFKGRVFLIKKIELRGKINKIDPGKFLQYTLRNRRHKANILFQQLRMT